MGAGQQKPEHQSHHADDAAAAEQQRDQAVDGQGGSADERHAGQRDPHPDDPAPGGTHGEWRRTTQSDR